MVFFFLNFFWLVWAFGYVGVSGWGVLRGAVLPGSTATTGLCSPVLHWCQHRTSCWRQHQRDCDGNARNASEFCVCLNGCVFDYPLDDFPWMVNFGDIFYVSVFRMNYMVWKFILHCYCFGRAKWIRRPAFVIGCSILIAFNILFGLILLVEKLNFGQLIWIMWNSLPYW